MTRLAYLFLFLGFLGVAITGYVGGSWVQGWVLGSLPAMCFWLGTIDLDCYGKTP